MNDLVINMLLKIEKFPQLWFGKISLERLFYWIIGFEAGIREVDSDYKSVFSKFRGYIDRFYPNMPSLGWDRLILQNATDDEDAFWTFYHLLHKFIDDEIKKE